jgi:hypothetical protein
MPRVYCLDTSALIYAMNERYPPKHFPSLWEKVDALIEEGRLISSEEVYKELEKKDDEAHEWCKKRKPIFVPLDDVVMEKTKEILAVAQRLVDTKRQRQQADPFVIAQAAVAGATVLTNENHRTGSTKAPRIPDVCDMLHVDCFTFLDLIQEEGWVF